MNGANDSGVVCTCIIVSYHTWVSLTNESKCSNVLTRTHRMTAVDLCDVTLGSFIDSPGHTGQNGPWAQLLASGEKHQNQLGIIHKVTKTI